jgi:hypothetical protein
MFQSKIVCDSCKSVFTNEDQAKVSYQYLMHTCESFDDNEEEN